MTCASLTKFQFMVKTNDSISSNESPAKCLKEVKVKIIAKVDAERLMLELSETTRKKMLVLKKKEIQGVSKDLEQERLEMLQSFERRKRDLEEQQLRIEQLVKELQLQERKMTKDTELMKRALKKKLRDLDAQLAKNLRACALLKRALMLEKADIDQTKRVLETQRARRVQLLEKGKRALRRGLAALDRDSALKRQEAEAHKRNLEHQRASLLETLC